MVREFTATDENNNTSTFRQRITIVNNGITLTAADIIWPRDTTISNFCNPATDPSQLPLAYSRPRVRDGSCYPPQINQPVDEVFVASEGACYKILRAWAVWDECTSQVFRDTQVIKVEDGLPPVVTCPADITVNITTGDCNADFFLPRLPTYTDCSAEISLTTTGNFFGSNQVVSGQLQNVPPGNYTVTYNIADGCGNIGSCQQQVTVRDGKAPGALCVFLSTSPMLMPIPSDGFVDVNAKSFVTSLADNCTPVGDIIVTYSQSLTDTVRRFTCDSIGIRTVHIWLTDAAGNQDQICESYIDIQNLDGRCPNGGAVITGRTANIKGTSVPNVEVRLSSNEPVKAMTNAAGMYNFGTVQTGYDYSLTPIKDDELLKGISTYDLVRIQRHILRVAPMTDPYELIAADVNNSKTISSMDLVHLRRLILGIDAKFSNNTSWRFVDANYRFPNPANPWQEVFPEVMSINDMPETGKRVDFTAIKIGDVNGSYQPIEGEAEVGGRSGEVLSLGIADRMLQAGETVEVPLTWLEAQPVQGMQFTLHFDPSALTLTDVQGSDWLQPEHLGLNQLDKGHVLVSWTRNGQDIPAQSTLMTLRFTAESATTLASALQLNDSPLQPEAYREEAGEVLTAPVQLQFSGPSAGDFVLLPNRPNPFKESTLISFRLPEAAPVTLTVFDLSGRVLLVRKADFEAGYQEMTVLRSEIPAATGVLMYRVDTPNHTGTAKMILLD